jgi:hypothetical protein
MASSVQVPKFDVDTPIGRVDLTDLDRLSQPWARHPTAIRRFGNRLFREGESVTYVPEIVGPLDDITWFKLIRKSTGYSLRVIAETLWLLGLPWRSFVDTCKGLTPTEIHKRYSHLCLDAARLALGIQPTSLEPLLKYVRRLPVELIHMLYRSRRSTAPARPSDPLRNLESFITPIDKGVDEIASVEQSYAALGKALFKSRKVAYESTIITPLRSGKSTCFVPASRGGYNVVIGILCDFEYSAGYVELLPNTSRHVKTCKICNKVVDEKPDFCGWQDQKGIFDQRPHAEDLFTDAVHYRNTWLRAFNVSLLLLAGLNRPLVAYAIQLNERAMKDRTPCIPEAFAQTVAAGISCFGFRTLAILFPVEFRKKAKPRMAKCNWYKSGDYKDSTSYIIWEAARVAWKIILDASCLDNIRKFVFMEAIRKLIGPHIFFSSSESRKEIESFLYPIEDFANVRGLDGKLYKTAREQSDPLVLPQVEYQEFSGVGKGFRTPCRAFLKLTLDMFKQRLAKIPEFLTGQRTLKSIRGILMSYRIAAPALMVLNAIPHWEMKSLRRGSRFFCSGDDNASGHRDREHMAALERKKSRSGMQVHDKVKAFESRRGFILTEELFVETRGSNYLKRVPNFPIRCLNPEVEKALDFITVPMDVKTNLKEIRHSSFLHRLTALLLKRYRRQYSALRGYGISISGPDSIIKWENWDGLPYTSSTVPGLYTCTLGSDGIGVDDLSQFIVAKKIFASDVRETSDPYITRRCSRKDVEATLSTVPSSNPYRKQYPYKQGAVRDGVRAVLNNLSDFIEKAEGRSHYFAVSPDGGEHQRVPKNPKKQLVVSREAYAAVRLGRWFSFHSDVGPLSRGVFPTSEASVELSFDHFSNNFIVDKRNLFGGEEKYPNREPSPLPSALMNSLLRKLLKLKWFRAIRFGMVFVVMEQPGVPRMISVTPTKFLVISRPRIGSLGADQEICDLFDILRRRHRVSPRVFTKDKKVLAYIRRVRE